MLSTLSISSRLGESVAHVYIPSEQDGGLSKNPALSQPEDYSTCRCEAKLWIQAGVSPGRTSQLLSVVHSELKDAVINK